MQFKSLPEDVHKYSLREGSEPERVSQNSALKSYQCSSWLLPSSLLSQVCSSGEV